MSAQAGSIVGAAPFRQQMMQIAGVSVAALVMAPILTLLHNNTDGGIGGRLLPAPQAGLFQSLAEGFFKADGEKLPWDLIGYGAIVGLVILGLDTWLKVSKAKFRAHLMPTAVGMYLPFGLGTPILIGGLLAYFTTRGKHPDDHDHVLHRGVLFSSGVIAGEALMSVGIACLAAMEITSLSREVLSLVFCAVAILLFAMYSRAKR